MAEAKLHKIKSRRMLKSYHAQRQRKSTFGMMQQFDGSYHDWLPLSDLGELCILASIDDATGKITHLKLGRNEGVCAVFHFWKEYVERHGIPGVIYTDKYSTYKINNKHAVDNEQLMT